MVTCERVEMLLCEHGYEVIGDTGEHRLYEHHGDRVVVPLHSAELSSWSARVIEQSLEPRLGPGWLSDPRRADIGVAAEPPRVLPTVRLNLVVRSEADRSAWNAFVVEEPRILTFGPRLAVVRRRAADAANAWYAGTASVELVPHYQLDADARRWTDPLSDPASAGEARRELARLGFSGEDIDELLGERTT